MLTAIILLAFCGLAFAATFAIPKTNYDSLGAEVWPRFVIAAVSFFSLIYLIESIFDKESPRVGAHGGVVGFIKKYSNAILCYVLFGLFVVLLPYIGMLLSGWMFVFLMLTVIGKRTAKSAFIHLVISVTAVAGLWTLFTFGLQVMLPEGVIF